MKFAIGNLEIETTPAFANGFKKLDDSERIKGVKPGPLFATLPFKPLKEEGFYQLRVWDGNEFGEICHNGSHVDSGSAKSKLLMDVLCERRDTLVRLIQEFTNYAVPKLIGEGGEQVQVWRVR